MRFSSGLIPSKKSDDKFHGMPGQRCRREPSSPSPPRMTRFPDSGDSGRRSVIARVLQLAAGWNLLVETGIALGD
ncbi:MAG: hypothetical protein MZV63_37590 [Marinilabiliales bacterium]|nr:hypothetical protein [Marinilabiliales bacterium]